MEQLQHLGIRLQPVVGHLITAVRLTPRRPCAGRWVAVVMAKRSRPDFPGVLNEPILKGRIFLFGLAPGDPDGERTAYEKRLEELRLEKLIKLMDYYKIKPPEKSPWYILAYRLACDFVPGMRVVDSLPRRGRPRGKWALELAHRFYDEVNAITAERPSASIPTAIGIVRNRSPKEWRRYSPKTLETRYYELKASREANQAMRAVGLLGDTFSSGSSLK